MRFVQSCSLAAALLATAFVGHALAGGSSAPFGYTPDPALRTASPSELQTRIRRSCLVTQARLQGVPEAQVGRGCGCYAQGVLQTFTQAEVDYYRASGVFDQAARGKALAVIDGCGLRRPL